MIDKTSLDILKYSNDPMLFTTDLIGLECKWFHQEWLEAFEKNRFTVLLAPRGHGKTSIVGSYILWRICRNRNIRILIVTINQNKANAMMTFIQENLSKNDKLIEVFGEFRGYSSWSRDQIRVKQLGKSTVPHNEPTLQVLGVNSRVISAHYDLIILDDITDSDNSRTETRRRQLEDWYNGDIIGTFLDNTQLINIGCIPASERVLMSDNTYKNINEVLPGEEVYTYSDNGLQPKKVLASIPQGKKEVFKLHTSNTDVEATYDHPFLSYNKITKNLEYKKLIELTTDDYVVCPRKIDSVIMREIPEFGKNSKEFMWLFGFMTGDGWVTEHPNKEGSMRYVTCFSKGIDEDLNNKVIDYIGTLFGYNPSKIRDDGVVLYYRNILGRVLKHCGLKKGAKNKDIPDWIFQQPVRWRIAFLRGLMDADGTKTGLDRWSIETSSQKLVKDIKRLCKISGIKSTPIYERKRNIKAPNSKLAIKTNTYHTSISFESYRNKDKLYKSILGDINLHNDFGLEQVKYVELLGEKEVYDLSIEGNSNFIVEGLIVHNTRWHEDDIHSFFVNKSGFKTLKYKALLNEEEIQQGKPAKVLWPEHLPWNEEMAKEFGKDPDSLNLQFIRAHQGEVYFQMQYQNNIVASGLSKFKPEWVDLAITKFKKLDIIPLNLKTYIGVDIGGEDKTSDWGVSTVVGVDERGDIYIIDSNRTHSSTNRQFEIMKTLDGKYHASRIGMESVAQQKHMVSEVAKNNPNLPILPIKSSWVNDRETRTDRLSILFETGRVYLNPALTHLIDELRVYPRGKHDDCIDSLSFAIEASQKGGIIDWSRVNDVMMARSSRKSNLHKI